MNTKNQNIGIYDNACRIGVSRRQQKILIVDDQSTGRDVISQLVQKDDNNVSVEAVKDSLEALEWLDSNHPNLIITDYRMPGMNGIEFIKKIRAKAGYQDIPIMMITVVGEKAIRHEALEAGATAFLIKPIDKTECRISCRNLLKLHEQHLIIQDKAERLERKVKIATEEIAAREKETLIGLAKASEFHDGDTGFHILRMAKYSKEIASALGLTEDECDQIEYSAPLHDIGKIGTPDRVLLKPGKLDVEEAKIMKQHAQIGYSILSNSQSKYMQMGAVIALNHHEKFDGSGYPNGISGNDIPLVARIVSIADVYDALVSPRPYKKGWSDSDAQAYLRKHAGSQFDPICVDAFFDRIDNIRKIQSSFNDEN